MIRRREHVIRAKVARDGEIITLQPLPLAPPYGEMDSHFVDSSKSGVRGRGQREDAATRARRAREERQRVRDNAGAVAQEATELEAATAIQEKTRRWLALLRTRELQREEWDAAMARDFATTAGQQLALCNWLLRFLSPLLPCLLWLRTTGNPWDPIVRCETYVFRRVWVSRNSNSRSRGAGPTLSELRETQPCAL